VDRDPAAGAIEEAGSALTNAGRAAPDAPVPSCPGWTVATVVKHIGLVHTWAAGLLRTYPTEAPPFPKAPPEVTPDELPDWADTQRDALVRAVRESDGARDVWAFGRPRPASFWWRRQAVETSIHAWDATNAVSTPYPVRAGVGVEGIEELLDGILPRKFAGEPPLWGRGRTIHFHRTDGDGEWLLTIDDPPEVSLGHTKGDLAVRGPAAELLLWATNRRVTGVELFGDERLAAGWARNVEL
jgi:uncharacterized protein (TIGR03083 family)